MDSVGQPSSVLWHRAFVQCPLFSECLLLPNRLNMRKSNRFMSLIVNRNNMIIGIGTLGNDINFFHNLFYHPGPRPRKPGRHGACAPGCGIRSMVMRCAFTCGISPAVCCTVKGLGGAGSLAP